MRKLLLLPVCLIALAACHTTTVEKERVIEHDRPAPEVNVHVDR